MSTDYTMVLFMVQPGETALRQTYTVVCQSNQRVPDLGYPLLQYIQFTYMYTANNNLGAMLYLTLLTFQVS
jgi:hypothetical protein